MPNANLPRGLTPRRHQSGAPFNGATNRYYLPAGDATNVFVGGLVAMAGSADGNGVPTVTGNVATGATVVGVVMGFEINERADLAVMHRAGSSARYVHVADDPDLIWEVQADGAVAAVDMGLSANLTGFTAGSPATGRSAIQVSSASFAAVKNGNEDVQIIKLAEVPDNELGVNANLLVRLRNHQFSNKMAGV